MKPDELGFAGGKTLLRRGLRLDLQSERLDLRTERLDLRTKRLDGGLTPGVDLDATRSRSRSPSTSPNASRASATNASGVRTCSPRSLSDLQREMRPWPGA